jgi:hypothetical protein
MGQASRVSLILCGSAVLLTAQFETATVLGTVRDSSGLPVKAARVTLQSLGTGLLRTSQTDDNGGYEFLTVRIGRYTVAAEAAGFKKAVAEEFTVTVGARQRVDLSLELGAVTESVTVQAAAALLEMDTSSRGTVVGSQQIVNLPLNGRAYADLALLAPGVRRSGISGSRDASFNVNGMRSSQNNFVIDGVDNNAYGTSNQGFSNQVVQLTPDAVAEFRLETNNFSAEYGRAGGAVINAAIKSGTNEFHGAVWEYLRNTKLNAEGFFHPRDGKPVLIQNQYGGALGGPIRKNSMFFFADYEGYRRVSKQIAFSTLPNAAMRRGELGIPVMNPYDGSVYPNGTIPASQIRRHATDILNDLPAPNRAGIGPLGVGNNFEGLPVRTDNTDKGDLRYDHYLSSKVTLFGRYSHRLLENFEPPAIPGPSGGNANGNVRVRNWQVASGVTWTLSPTSLVEARMGASLTEGGKTPIFAGTQTIGDRFGIPNIPKDPRFTGGVPGIGINGFTAIGVQTSNPQFQDPMVYNPKVNYSRLSGRHSLKAGYEFQKVHTEIDDFNPKYGSYSFGGRFSQAPGTANDDRQFIADFLLGARSNYSLNNPVIVNYRQRMQFLYLQDDFKVSSRLTLNLGVRYEYGTPQWERDNRLSNVDGARQELVQARSGGVFDRALVRPDRNNWAPRVGLAYSLGSKTVVRSAYGLSYIHFNRMGGENILAYNLPFILNPNINQVAPALARGGQPLCPSLDVDPATCFLPFERGFPNNFLSLGNIRQRSVRANHIPFDLPSARVQAWHFTIQQSLGGGWVVDIGYVGTRGRNLMILGDLNQARPNNTGENLSIDARRPIQQFGYVQTAFPGGFLDYHAFQTKVERRFSGGLYFLNSFTWSKAIDNASGHLEAQNGDNSRVNFLDLRSEKGLSGYDQPFGNTTTLLYDLPFGKNRRWGQNMARAADLVAGGWRVTLINFLSSGTPVNLSYSPSAAQQVSGAPTYRPNITGDPLMPAGQRTVVQWLNPATVVAPTDVTRPFGNAGRNIVRGPGPAQLNFGLHKDFPITERTLVEFRMEAFNLFNRTNLGIPNANRSSGSFGAITSLGASAREIQFALRLAF